MYYIINKNWEKEFKAKEGENVRINIEHRLRRFSNGDLKVVKEGDFLMEFPTAGDIHSFSSIMDIFVDYGFLERIEEEDCEDEESKEDIEFKKSEIEFLDVLFKSIFDSETSDEGKKEAVKEYEEFKKDLHNFLKSHGFEILDK